MLAEPAVQTVMSAFHMDANGLLRLLAANTLSSSTSARRQLLMAALAELPIVQDVVAAINATTDKDEERRLLSFLSQTFTRAAMNQDLGLKEAVSKRKFYYDRSLAKAYGAGATAPHVAVTRLRVNATQFEDALRFICNPTNMQVRFIIVLLHKASCCL
jgi:hypothetical protein